MRSRWWPILLSPLVFGAGFGAGMVLPHGWGVVPIAGLYAYACILLIIEIHGIENNRRGGDL